jgi:adenylosuccinate lyase
MDQISEHQRDLSNSASGRFVVEYIAGFAAAAERTRRILERLRVDEGGIERNLEAGVQRVLAEPLYILLAAGGREDAHEQIRRLTLTADEEEASILTVARRDPELWNTVTRTYRALTGGDPDQFFSDPEHYIGRAVERTQAICDTHRALLREVRGSL